MPLQIRRRPRVDDAHLPDTLHPLLRQIFASRGVEDPALLERSASQLLPRSVFSDLRSRLRRRSMAMGLT